jgi:hypothetical protein
VHPEAYETGGSLVKNSLVIVERSMFLHWLICGHGQAKDELSVRRCWPVSSVGSAYKVEAGAKATTASEAAVELFHPYWIAKRLIHNFFILRQRNRASVIYPSLSLRVYKGQLFDRIHQTPHHSSY